MAINAVLDGLAEVVRAAIPIVTIHAPDQTLSPVAIYPVVQIYPYKLHLERTETGLWGNAMAEQAHSHGPDLYRLALLQLPLKPRIDDLVALFALQDNVERMRRAFTAHPDLADGAGIARVLDAGDHIQADYDGQGSVVAFRRVPYIGARLTVEVQQLRQRGVI